MIFGINTTRDIYFKIVSNFTPLTAREITYNIFEISLVVFMTNIATNHAITYTNSYTCPLNHVSKLLVENLVLFTLSDGLNPSLSQDYKERPPLVPVLVPNFNSEWKVRLYGD